MCAVFRLGRAVGDTPVEVPDEVFDALIGAIDDRIRDCLDTRDPGTLAECAPLLYQITLALFGVPQRRPESA
ncbi:hypothetical protein [Nocardia sp. SYP-A9097]|uniref:hypothetical protein n=1 Tax=Nocardia sp. SYP-A9097 TaxID=2663237 RepID=UPI00129AD02F|nr:hypothetical protein [Nocardia sp. SYP-A9097]